MATRLSSPLLDIDDFEDAELREIDQMAAMEEAERDAPLAVEDALRLAEEGDPLELDLMRSGFYGEQLAANVADMLTPESQHRLALDALGDLIIRMREAAIERRWGTDEQTLLNFAFRNGHHYVEVDPARRAVVPMPAPRDAVRRKINKFEPWYRAQHSKLSAARPQHHIRPKKGQQRTSRDASRFAEELAEWVANDTYSLHNRAELAMWLLLSGNAVWHCYVDWVPGMGGVDPETGEPLAMPVLRREVLGPQSCWCDDRVPRIKDMRWFGVDRFMPVAEARARYPEHAREIVPETMPESPGVDDRGLGVLRRVQRLTAREDPWHTGEVRSSSTSSTFLVDEEEETILLEFWARAGAVFQARFLDRLDPSVIPFEVIPQQEGGDTDPVVRFPQGLRVVLTTRGKVLEIGPNIYGELPFREVRVTKSPGFWSYAPATPLREINQAINWAWSLREMHLLKTANAPLLEPVQARVRRRGLLAAMQRVRYRANRFGAKPEVLDPPPLPTDTVQFMDALERVWQDIAAMHEVSQGKLPAKDISGIAISLLQEQDIAQLGFTGEELEESYVDILRMQLVYIQRFFPADDPRLLQLAGDAPYMLNAFMLANLEDGLDIQVVRGSSIPRSPAAVEAKAKEAWQLGFLVDEFGRPDYRRMQEIFGFGTADDLYAEDELDTQNARSEEDAILALPPPQAALIIALFQQTGQLPPFIQPQPEDDQLIHERSHRRRLKEIRNDPRVHPANTMLLRIHWQIHLLAAAPLLMQMEPGVMVGAMAGAGGGTGGELEGGEEQEDGEQTNDFEQQEAA